MDGEDLVVSRPNPVGAVMALDAAADLLASAADKLAMGDYEGAFSDARNSMRLASSALLLRDGYVAVTLEATVSYLEERYTGMVPMESWMEMETAFPGETAGIMGRLLGALGKNKRIDRESTEQALAAARSFLRSARAILGVR
jgi:uncharacterized protein (UPF0332 family)